MMYKYTHVIFLAIANILQLRIHQKAQKKKKSREKKLFPHKKKKIRQMLLTLSLDINL